MVAGTSRLISRKKPALPLAAEGFAIHAQLVPHLAIILVLTGLVHCLDTASYASRIAGTRTGRLALTGALFNIVSLFSRAAYTLQAPLLGSAIDRMVRGGNLGGLLGHCHLIIAAASIGTLAGALLIPTFAALFSRAATAYDSHGSFPALLLHTLSLRGFSRISQHLRLPLPESVLRASRRYSHRCLASRRPFRRHPPRPSPALPGFVAGVGDRASDGVRRRKNTHGELPLARTFHRPTARLINTAASARCACAASRPSPESFRGFPQPQPNR